MASTALAISSTRWRRRKDARPGEIVAAGLAFFPERGFAATRLQDVARGGLGMFRRLLELGVARGEFRPMDVESTAFCIVAPMVLGMMWRHSFARHEQRPFDAAALCRAQLHVLSLGLVLPGKGGPAKAER